MQYLFLLKSNESSQLSYLQNILSEHLTNIVLMQDGAYLAPTIKELLEQYHSQHPPRIHVLQEDALKRGITQQIPPEINQINYDQLVDLLFQEDQKVLNL